MEANEQLKIKAGDVLVVRHGTAATLQYAVVLDVMKDGRPKCSWVASTKHRVWRSKPTPIALALVERKAMPYEGELFDRAYLAAGEGRAVA